ncbi:hypothetical protein FH972_024364 [Carpinus fangiana]|uniref:Uncharacterized protein n=1 Tax=Carpinus fangiana TaxID=176857 RepID=A0A5N6KY94_9ROSI|nr:hypothetical protein FH972_024364 [Carpinus fangiana]
MPPIPPEMFLHAESVGDDNRLPRGRWMPMQNLPQIEGSKFFAYAPLSKDYGQYPLLEDEWNLSYFKVQALTRDFRLGTNVQDMTRIVSTPPFVWCHTLSPSFAGHRLLPEFKSITLLSLPFAMESKINFCSYTCGHIPKEFAELVDQAQSHVTRRLCGFTTSVYRCHTCASEFSIKIKCCTALQWALTIFRWIDLGDTLSPFSAEWQGAVSKSSSASRSPDRLMFDLQGWRKVRSRFEDRKQEEQ